MSSRFSSVWARLGLSAFAVVASFLAAEAATRWLAPVAELFPHWQWDTLPTNWEGSYVVDSDLGYRPVFGAGEYSELGTVVNEYPVEKASGVTRVLFLGDSVTHRWRMQRVLVQRCRESPIEFWNAGVEGFNTGQEVEYYLRWNYRVDPDHVTLVFHNNDFIATPVVFRDNRGEVVVANPQAYLSKRDVALAGWSHLYRHYLGARIARMLESDPVTSGTETKAALATLKAELETNGVGFDIVLLPVLKPLEEWTVYERRSRSLSLEIFDQLEIPYHDLLPVLERSLRDRMALTESPEDLWHPSDQLARRFARHLLRSGYLEAVLPPSGCGSIPPE